jgi:hypothetical protein
MMTAKRRASATIAFFMPRRRSLQLLLHKIVD